MFQKRAAQTIISVHDTAQHAHIEPSFSGSLPPKNRDYHAKINQLVYMGLVLYSQQPRGQA